MVTSKFKSSVLENVSNCVIKGLVINRGNGPAIALENASNNLITDNFLGTNFEGTQALPNSVSGLYLEDNCSFNLIENNLISGNIGEGIFIDPFIVEPASAASNNSIRNNKIGTDQLGMSALPNTGNGIEIYQSRGNIIEDNFNFREHSVGHPDK